MNHLSDLEIEEQNLEVGQADTADKEELIRSKFLLVMSLLENLEENAYDDEFKIELLHWLTVISMDTTKSSDQKVIPAPLEGYISLLDSLLKMQLYTEARLVVKKIRKIIKSRNPEQLTIVGLIEGNTEKAREILAFSGIEVQRAKNLIRVTDPKNRQQVLETAPDLKNIGLSDEELTLRFATKQLATKIRFFGSDEYKNEYLNRLQNGFLSENEFIAICSIVIDKSSMEDDQKEDFKEWMSKIFAFNRNPEKGAKLVSPAKMKFCNMMMDLTGYKSIALPLPTQEYFSEIN